MLKPFVIEENEGYFLHGAKIAEGDIEIDNNHSIVLNPTGKTKVFLTREECDVHHSLEIIEKSNEWHLCFTSLSKGLLMRHEYTTNGGDDKLYAKSALMKY